MGIMQQITKSDPEKRELLYAEKLAMSSNILLPRRPVTDGDYRLMVESASDHAIYMLDPDGFILSWNVGAKLLKGCDADEIIGKHFSLFYPPELLERNWPQHELTVAAAEGRFEDEGWRVRKDGSRFWASVVITRLLDPDGNLRGFCKITRDLSERRRQDELLRNSEERFRLLVEGVKDYAIFMLDPSGYVVSWNIGAFYNKGYEAHEIIGKHFSIFYPEEVAAAGWPDTELRMALENGRYEEEGWRVRKDGTRFWANVVITALFDQTGRHRGFAKVTRDLTEKRRAAALEDEGRRITAFIAMLAHELRNPIAPIANAAAIMNAIDALPTNAQFARDIISRQVKQLTRLVDDLLDISRISAGKIHLESKPVLLDEVLAEAVETISPLIKNKEQTLTLDMRERAIWVKGDRTRLIQILSNLLHNAMKFTQNGGQISVSLGVDDGAACFTVSDDGPGIAPEHLPHLFNRFAQREDDNTKIFGGLGLGLSLVQHLTTLQGGSVSAISSGVTGEGSEFTIRLPRIDALQREIAAAESKKKLLVVDDNRDSAHTLALLLNSMGYDVSIAYSGREAIEKAKHSKPHVALLDIGLPDLDGVQVARKLITETADPPVFIATTGYGMDKDRERSFNAGFYAHLIKPVDPEKLRAMLQLILENKS